MARTRTLLRWAGLVGGCVAAWGGAAHAGPLTPAAKPPAALAAEPTPALPVAVTSHVPLKDLPAETRERIRDVLERPTLATRGPQETFNCRPDMYHWLLGNPDQAVKLWRMLGAKAADIRREGDDRFGWQDGHGSRLTWHTVHASDTQRIWYAEGNVKPALLVPMAKVKALAILTFAEGKDAADKPVVRHQVELVLHTDSSALALAAKLLGPSAPKRAEQYVGQIQMFFAAMAWYLDRHPDEAAKMLEELRREK